MRISLCHTLAFACLAGLAPACSSDTTRLFDTDPSPKEAAALTPAPNSPPASVATDDVPPAGTTTLADGTATGTLVQRPLLPAKEPPKPPEPPLPLPCVLELQWSNVVASHAGCKPLSGALGVAHVLWDGSQVTLLGEAIEPVGSGIERTRACTRHLPPPPDPSLADPSLGDEDWRFVEAFDFGALPTDHCPTAFSASYIYTECLFQLPGIVCRATPDTNACTFTATLQVTPATQASGAADAGASPIAPSEQACLPLGEPPLRVPVLIGSACRDTTECQAGSFCSRELPGGSCLPFEEGFCQPAPRFAECSDASEPACGCDGRRYRPTLPDGLNANACRLRAVGETAWLCTP